MERSRMPASNRAVTYVEVAKDEELAEADLRSRPPGDHAHAGRQWKTLGDRACGAGGPRQGDRAGTSIRPTSSGPACCMAECCGRRSIAAKLVSVDLAPAKAMEGVVAVQDGEFVGVVGADGVCGRGRRSKPSPKRRSGTMWRCRPATSCTIICARMPRAACRRIRLPLRWRRRAKSLRATYTIAYVQHAPLEPRTAVAEWTDGKLTVWTATQNPFGVRGELAQAFRLADDAVRVDRARFRQRLRRQAHGRIGGRGGPVGAGGEEAGDAPLDARGGVHVGLFPAGGGDRCGGVAR